MLQSRRIETPASQPQRAPHQCANCLVRNRAICGALSDTEREMLGREGRTAELNPTSFRDALMYQREMDAEVATPSLFDFLEMEEAS